MSWSITPAINGLRAADAKQAINEAYSTPQTIKDYICAGIDGLVALHGEDVTVKVTGQGHLCSGKDYDVTSATVEVRRSEVVTT